MPPLKNQRLEALPNVLRNQTIPNRLGGHGAEPRQVARVTLPVRRVIAMAIGLAVFVGLLVGRA